MKSRLLLLLTMVALLFGLLAGTAPPARASAQATTISCTTANTITTCTGSFTDSFGLPTAFVVEKPAQWNTTLVLYSHGLVAPGGNNPALDAPNSLAGGWLLTHGYGLAGTSYSTTGWAVQQAFDDQMRVLGIFAEQFGSPGQTLAWGDSLGGMITAGLVQLHPHTFAAALPMCGVLGGGVGSWNEGLDTAFALKTLLAPNSNLQVVHITNPMANFGLGLQIVGGAQTTAQGRARLALVAALSDIPGWANVGAPEPAAKDYVAQEKEQFQYLTGFALALGLAFRADVEARAGGNPSWNTGVDYRVQLSHSADLGEVIALYKQAGMSLNDDLATLNGAPRISADLQAVNYLAQFITFNGQISIPVLTMHTTADGVVATQSEQAYASVVRSAGNNRLLRQVFVHRANHCSFTPAEQITAFQTLVLRLQTGRWEDLTGPARLNQQAAELGPTYNLAPPAFVQFQPTRFLRPFDARDLNG